MLKFYLTGSKMPAKWSIHKLRVAARRRGRRWRRGALRDGGGRGGGAAPRQRAARRAAGAAAAAVHGAAEHQPHLHADGVGRAAALAAARGAGLRAPLPRQPVTQAVARYHAHSLLSDLTPRDRRTIPSVTHSGPAVVCVNRQTLKLVSVTGDK